MYTVAALMVPIASVQPASLALYWATSGVAGILINLTLLHPRYRALLKIPKTPKDSATPYLDIKEYFVSIITKLRR